MLKYQKGKELINGHAWKTVLSLASTMEEVRTLTIIYKKGPAKFLWQSCS